MTCALGLVVGLLGNRRAQCYSLPLFATNRTITGRSSIGVLYVCVGGLDILKFDKKSTDL